TEGVLHAMMMTRIKTASAVALVTLILGLGGGLLLQPGVFEQPALVAGEPPRTPEPALENSKPDEQAEKAEKTPPVTTVDKPLVPPPPDPPNSDSVDRV